MAKSGFMDKDGFSVEEGDWVIFKCPYSPLNERYGLLTYVTQDGDAEVLFTGDRGTTPVKWNHLYKYEVNKRSEYEEIEINTGSYEFALYNIKKGQLWRRKKWKPGKLIRLINELKNYKPNPYHTFMAHLAIEYDDGRIMPWIPTQCDQFENDWEEVKI